ncbi:MAG TPA: hypothetical protein PKA41_00520 [Verrucomicrobiota bacterium]|nr:hypothetical protein [Verrucomicrobiota bacterium]
MTLAELQALYPPIPDDENAAVAMIELWKSEDPEYWQAFLANERPLPEKKTEAYDPYLPYLGAEMGRVPRSQPLASNALLAAETYLSNKAGHMEQFRIALRRARFQFPTSIEDGPAALLPHLALMKSEAQSFRIAALVATERGDSTAAIRHLQYAALTGQALTNEPTIIGHLVRIACLAITLDGAGHLLSKQSLSLDQLTQLEQLAEDIQLPGACRTALVRERPFSLCLFDPVVLARTTSITASDSDASSTEDDEYRIRTGLSILRKMGLLDADRKLMLTTLATAIDLAAQGTPESLIAYEELLEGISVSAKKYPPKMFSALMLPSLSKVPQRFATLEAQRRSCLTAIGVERYRADHNGTIPTTLEQLVPTYLQSVPLDPFDGQPLRFKRLDKGFVIYSVGNDREDNDGKERVSGGKGGMRKMDVTFFVER